MIWPPLVNLRTTPFRNVKEPPGLTVQDVFSTNTPSPFKALAAVKVATTPPAMSGAVIRIASYVELFAAVQRRNFCAAAGRALSTAIVPPSKRQSSTIGKELFCRSNPEPSPCSTDECRSVKSDDEA